MEARDTTGQGAHMDSARLMAIRLELVELRADVALMLKARERAQDMAATMRAAAAENQSYHSRESFYTGSAIKGLVADGYSARIAATRARIAELEAQLPHGGLLDRVMQGQYEAMDETMQAVAP